MNKTKLMPEKQIIEYEFTLPVKINKFKGKPQLIHSFPHFHGYEIEIQFIVEGDGKKNSRHEVFLSDNEVAGIFKISNSHLFKRETGMSFKKYIIERRLFESEKLLQSENTKISSIAKKCGFSDMTFFMKKFKEKFGITPLQYKKIIKKEGL